MSWIILISFVIVLEVFADILAKEYALKGNWYFWLGSLLFYLAGTIFWLSSIKNGSGLGRGVIIFSVGTSIAAIIAGIIFYGETANKVQLTGMILGALSLALIIWE